jgi:hypothetical protein
MSIRYSLMVFAAIFMAHPVFADDDMNLNDKPCGTIVKSCKDAGYTHHGDKEKKFWKGCMQPLLLGKTVSGISVDEKDVKTCREAKIKKLKQELAQLEAVK